MPNSAAHDYHAFFDRLADAAAEAILPHFRETIDVENKKSGGFDPVTAADRESEAAMRALINATFPDHGIVGEEYGSENETADHVWVLDPIDGTRSFISGLPVWGVLIGLLVEGRPRYGMMSQPFTGERFFGDGRQSRYQDRDGARLIRTRPCGSVAEASLFTTSPDMFEASDLALFERLSARTRLRRFGMDCYAYCMLAAGFIDIVAETGLSSFDILPLVPIVESAGGRIVSWTGDDDLASGRVVALGDPALHDDVVAILSGRG